MVFFCSVRSPRASWIEYGGNPQDFLLPSLGPTVPRYWPVAMAPAFIKNSGKKSILKYPKVFTYLSECLRTFGPDALEPALNVPVGETATHLSLSLGESPKGASARASAWRF
jgi:hypothetical protein